MRKTPWEARLIVLIGFIAGGFFGYVEGLQRIEETIAAMKREFGWACGTGLELALAVYTSCGAVVGAMLAWLGSLPFRPSRGSPKATAR